jgi:large subunit ribosomal protein L18
MHTVVNRRQARRRIRYRIRRDLQGTATRPRLAVFRSLKNIYVQAIDDETGRTLAAASTLDTEIRGRTGGRGNVEAAKAVGRGIAEQLKQSGVETVIFDRGGFLFHGRVKALADAARESGLKF